MSEENVETPRRSMTDPVPPWGWPGAWIRWRRTRPGKPVAPRHPSLGSSVGVRLLRRDLTVGYQERLARYEQALPAYRQRLADYQKRLAKWRAEKPRIRGTPRT